MNDGYDWRLSLQYTIHQMRLLLAKLGVDDSNTRSSVSSSLSILFFSAIKARMELTAVAEMIVCRSKCLGWFMKDFSHFCFMFRPEDHSPLWKTFCRCKMKDIVLYVETIHWIILTCRRLRFGMRHFPSLLPRFLFFTSRHGGRDIAWRVLCLYRTW